MGATRLQFSPWAYHVLGGEVTIKASSLVEPDIVSILHWPMSDIEFINPHTHADIFHLE
jgi:hypothetical protein